MQEPCARIGRFQFQRFCGTRKDGQDVDNGWISSLVNENLTVEMYSVHVHGSSESKYIPGDLLSFVHDQALIISVNKTVDGIHNIAGHKRGIGHVVHSARRVLARGFIDVPTHHLVEQEKEQGDFSVDVILALPVFRKDAFPTDDDIPYQASIDVLHRVHRRVVGPADTIGVAFTGAGSVRNQPSVHIETVLGNHVIRVLPSVIEVGGTFVVLGVKHAMWMDGVGSAGHVLEDDFNNFPNFGSQSRP